jgi:site-specific DNA-methyltransferase (adenine-specific)|tara:strand:- start:23 stop:919 length:897 start_codon:yes stop_codon:yes gene_type:complete
MAVKYYNESFENSVKYIDNNSVELFFLDPPYYISGNKKEINLTNGKRSDWDSQWKTKDEFYHWIENMLKLAFDQLKENGSLYLCISWQHSHMFHLLLEKAGFTVQNRITWKRDKGRGSNINWKSMHEDVFFATKHPSKYTFNIEDVMVEKEVIAPYRNEDGTPKGWWETPDGKKIRMTYPGNIWLDLCVPYWSMHEVKSYAKSKKSPNNKFEKHNTQKPKDLVKRCILASSNKGDLVVDYFSGSGTTAIASTELNRNSIVFDINKTYIGMLEERLRNEIVSDIPDDCELNSNEFFSYK